MPSLSTAPQLMSSFLIPIQLLEGVSKVNKMWPCWMSIWSHRLLSSHVRPRRVTFALPSVAYTMSSNGPGNGSYVDITHM